MELWREDVLAHYGTAGMKWGVRKALIKTGVFVDPNKSRKQYEERKAQMEAKRTSSTSSGSGSGGTTTTKTESPVASVSSSRHSSSSRAATPKESAKKGQSLLDRLLGGGILERVQKPSNKDETMGYYKARKKNISVRAVANR